MKTNENTLAAPKPALMTTRRLTRLAMLAAVSIILLMAVRIPFPPAPFMKYDPADIPIFIGAFAFGPFAGVLLTIVASVVQSLTVSSNGLGIGTLMHILATGSYVVVAGLIYKRSKTKKSAILAMSAGTVTMTLVMVGCNLVFTPLFMGQSVQEVVAMLIPVIIPFNLLKAGINSVITFAVYKATERFLKD